MLRNLIFTGLLIGLFAAMTIAPVSLSARGACIAAWETGAVESYQRAVLQSTGAGLLTALRAELRPGCDGCPRVV
jgi:hypothetical protein